METDKPVKVSSATVDDILESSAALSLAAGRG